MKANLKKSLGIYKFYEKIENNFDLIYDINKYINFNFNFKALNLLSLPPLMFLHLNSTYYLGTSTSYYLRSSTSYYLGSSTSYYLGSS
jgi:hypothetical protein